MLPIPVWSKNSSDLSLSIKRKCCYKDKFKEGTDRSYYNDSKSGLHEYYFEIEGNEEGAWRCDRFVIENIATDGNNRIYGFNRIEKLLHFLKKRGNQRFNQALSMSVRF